MPRQCRFSLVLREARRKPHDFSGKKRRQAGLNLAHRKCWAKQCGATGGAWMTVMAGKCDYSIRVTRGLLAGLHGVVLRRQGHGQWFVRLNDFPAGVYFLLSRSAFEFHTSQTPAKS